MVKIRQWYEHISIILIGIALLILIFNKSLDKLPGMIVVVLFGAHFLINLCIDIRDKRYTTSTLIITADVIGMLTFILMCYFNYMKIDFTNDDLLWERSQNLSTCFLWLTIISAAITFLKRDSFLKKNNSDKG